jgi:hypothetical protein
MANNIDLGTLIDAEMFYSLSEKGKGKGKSNTLHTSDNVLAPTALAFASQASARPMSEEEEEKNSVVQVSGINGSTNQITQYKIGFVRLDPNFKYDEIAVQIANIRIGSRVKRANVYISLRPEHENMYNTFLTGAATDAKAELYRGCKNGTHVKDIIDDMFARYPNIMIARLRYKSYNGYITDFHKPLTKAAVVGIALINNVFTAILNLYNTEYVIPLIDPLSDEQLKYYAAQGTYRDITEYDDQIDTKQA